MFKRAESEKWRRANTHGAKAPLPAVPTPAIITATPATITRSGAGVMLRRQA